MHQPIISVYTHNPVDVSDTVPFVEKPYFDWLCRHPNPSPFSHVSMAEYLCPEYNPHYTLNAGMLHGTMPNQEYTAYHYTHQHYWHAVLKWDAATIRRNLHDWQADCLLTPAKVA